MSPDAAVRVEVKFKNARLYHAICDAAYKDNTYHTSATRGQVSAFCRFYGVPYGMVGQLLLLQLSPILKQPRNTYRPLCVTLSNILDIDCATLFPQALYAQSWPTSFSADSAPADMASWMSAIVASSRLKTFSAAGTCEVAAITAPRPANRILWGRGRMHFTPLVARGFRIALFL